MWVVVALLLTLPWQCWSQESSWPSYRASYGRIHDAQKQCSRSSGGGGSDGDEELGADPKWLIRHELSFQNGDWIQQPNARSSPLPALASNLSSRALQLASFWITDVDLRRSSGASIRISAVLELAISARRSIGYFASPSESRESSPGFSAATALLEGIYFESAADRGVCMVGCATLAPLKRSCDLFLELRFPRRVALQSREIRGFLRSASREFDDVAIAALMGAYSKYEFDDGKIVARACDRAQMPPQGIDVYAGARTCSLLMEILTSQWIPLSGSGPFSMNATVMQVLDIRCVDLSESRGKNLANVSAIVRAAPGSHDLPLAAERRGMSDGLAFAAEGVYSASTGELCMTGCRSARDRSSGSTRCDVRVSIFVPLSLSIAQRSILSGEITSLEESFARTAFRVLVPQRQMLPPEISRKLRYRYSRIEEAKARARLDDAQTRLADRVKRSLLKFPRLSHSLEQLGEDLIVSAPINEGIHGNSSGSMLVETQVLAIEDVVLTEWHGVQRSDVLGDDRSRSHGLLDDEKPLRVAVELNLFPVIRASVEGVYDPRTGRMFLVGCKEDVSSNFYAVLPESRDCETSVVIQYPPRNTQWLVNPIVRIHIESKNTKNPNNTTENSKNGNNLSSIEVETFPILYRDQLREILSRKTLEAVLSAITLSAMLACIALQLAHLKRSVDSGPFVSLLMLGVQAIGFSVPLITGAEALFARLTSRHSSSSPRSEAAAAIKDTALASLVLYLVKVLSLAAFLVMLRLCQKVVRYRIRLAAKFPLEPRRVPSELQTAKIFALVHAIGFLAVLVFHFAFSSSDALDSASWDVAIEQRDRDWIKELKEYAGVVEDLFLLPQVIAASVWEIKGKPLRNSYYLGMTALRLLPHAYDALSAPLFNPFFVEQSAVFADPRMDFYTRAGDVILPVLALLLAAMVYAQQRWNELKWGRLFRQGSTKLLRYGSKLYERLPSSKMTLKENFEAEMMPNAEDRRTLVDPENQ